MKKIAKKVNLIQEVSVKKNSIISKEPDSEFDEIMKFVTKICDVPIAYFTVNENGDEWIKSQYVTDPKVIIEANSLSSSAIQKNEIVIYNKNRNDLGQINGLEFFMAVPILIPLSKSPIGSLCIADKTEKKVTPEQIYTLQTLANQLQIIIQNRLLFNELTQVNQHFEDVQKIAKIGAWEIDLIDYNHKWSSEMFNLFDQNTSQGTPDWNLFIEKIHPDDVEKWKMAFKKCKESDKPQVVRFRSILPDRTIWVEAVGQQIIDKNGKITKIVGTCQDITTKILFEKQILEKNKLSLEKKQAVGLNELSSLMANELMDPLTVIDSNVQFLKNIKHSDKKVESKINTILKASARIGKIASRLNRFTPNKKDNLYKICAVSDLIPDVIHFTEHKIKLHNINLITVAQSEDLIYCNPNEIQQAVLHLINNSIDAVKDDNYPWIELKYFTQNNEVIIHITDSGTGIPYELEHKVFDPFYTTKKTTTGHGLGLSLSKNIIESHGGTLKINRKNKNTCFEIRIKKEQAKIKGAA